MQAAVISNDELRGILADNGIEPYNMVMLDASYVMPKASWMVGEYRSALAENIRRLGLGKYAREQWDCDDFSLLAVALAKINHRLNGNDMQAALAVGMLTYDREQMPKGRHAVVFGVCGKNNVTFIEPNGCVPITLSSLEKASVYDVVV